MEIVNVNSPRWFDMTDLDGEIWNGIEETKSLYSISTYGRIRRNPRTFSLHDGILRNLKPQIMKLEKNRQGYLQRRVQVDGKKITLRPQRLVAQYFLENPNNYPCVNHIDENKQNNHVSNLEYCSYSYNSVYGEGYKNRCKHIKEAKQKYKKRITQYSFDGKIIGTYMGYKEVEKAGYNWKAVSRCCQHKAKSSQGFVWRHEGDEFTHRQERRTGYKLHAKHCKVDQFDINMNHIATYNTIKEASRAFGKKTSNISACCRGLAKTCMGYIWKYSKE